MARELKTGNTETWKYRLNGVSGDAGFKGSTCRLTVESVHGQNTEIISGAKCTYESSTAAESSTSFGVVTFDPTTGQVANAGDFRAEFEVTFDDGQRATFPSNGYHKITIKESL